MRYGLPGAIGLLFQIGLAVAAGWQSSPANAQDSAGGSVVTAGRAVRHASIAVLAGSVLSETPFSPTSNWSRAQLLFPLRPHCSRKVRRRAVSI